MKKLSLMVVLAVLVVGCGGGGSSSDSTSEKYDMWDYIASKTSKTYTLDSYTSNSEYSITTNRVSNAGYIEYTVISSSKVMVDFDGDMTATLLLNNSSINIEGTSVGRYKSIGSKIGECTLSKHHDSLTIANEYTFLDVLEFDCSGYREFYVKDKGNIVNYTRTTYTGFGDKTTVYYGISVANNASD